MASIKEWICKYEMDCNSRIAMRKISLSICASLLFSTSSFAINCKDFGGEFATYSGHYYAITGNKMTFETAKQFATSNGGYLAIPNTTAENDFIKGIVGANNEALLGIYDPNYSQVFCLTGNCFSTNRTRFKTVAGASLTYQNWDSSDVENKLLNGDDSVDLYGNKIIATMGEPFTLISGISGLWRDWGTHFISGDNPMTMQAVIEFDTKPTCYEVPSNVVEEFSGRKCNTKIKDSKVLSGSASLVDCQTDTKGTEYCPSQMAECAQEWDYENGHSVENTGTAEDYTQKICDGVMINGICYDNSVKDATKVTSLSCVTKSIPCRPGAASCCHIDIACSGNSATVKYYGCCSPRGGLKKTVNITDANQFIDGVYYQPYTGSQGKIICDSNGACSVYYHNASCESKHSTGSPYLTNTFALNTSDSYVCNDSGYVNGSQISADPKKCYKQKALTCPSTHPSVQPDGTCKKSVNYKYYTYVCSNSQTSQGYNYITQNTGGDCISSKTDPNTSADNSTTLDDACNNSTPPANNCKRQKFTCQVSGDRPCALVNSKMQCSPFPCFGESNFENAGTAIGTNDKNNNGWSKDGSCAGQIYIFGGKDMRCRSSDKLFGLTGGGCCNKDKVALGLINCKDNEKMLAKKRQNDLCHSVGSYCSKKIKLGGAKMCVQNSDSYCCFNSKLARIFHEQGRPQLGMGWGSSDAPDCRGFKPEEFQKLDMSKMDLSEFTSSLPAATIDTGAIKNKVKNHVNTIN